MLMLEKLKLAKPYNLFFSSHPDVEETQNHKRFITFSDLLCPSLGNLKSLYYFTNTLDIEWLLEECDKAGYSNLPLTVLYGKEKPEIEELLKTHVHKNVTVTQVKSSDPYGKHHCKMGIFIYEDNSLRIVISTANLDKLSWNDYCQNIWVSPLCKPTAGDKDGNGPTNFKNSLLQYLNGYKLSNSNILNHCIKLLKGTDFSEVKVFLVTSVPGSHSIGHLQSECHLERVASLLSKHCTFLDIELRSKPWPIIIQASSVGNIGDTEDAWFIPALLRSIDSHYHNSKPRHSNALVQLIFPTQKDVLNSLSRNADPERHINFYLNDQNWPRKMLCSWRAEKAHLTRVLPRSKCYCRISPNGTKLAWFLLTSANCSKTAWGGRINRYKEIYVRSFEVGILFLPQLFGEEYFKIGGVEDRNAFPLMFDIPLTPYKDGEKAWHGDKID